MPEALIPSIEFQSNYFLFIYKGRQLKQWWEGRRLK
jgi:hypothetical protein